MRTFNITFDITAPAERVWEVMSDVTRWHEWTSSVTRIQRLGNGPLAVESRAVIRQPKFPPALWKVTALEPGRSFTWTTKRPGFRMVAHHSVEPTVTGSRATLSLHVHGVLGGVWGRITRTITQRYLALEAQGLKARSEDPRYYYSEAIH